MDCNLESKRIKIPDYESKNNQIKVNNILIAEEL
jgi:hypothetical protein